VAHHFHTSPVPASKNKKDSKTACSTVEISNADVHCVKGYEVFYMITFLFYLVSLKTGPYTCQNMFL